MAKTSDFESENCGSNPHGAAKNYTQFLGRKVIYTKLHEDIPRLMRGCLGHIVLSGPEMLGLALNDEETFKELAEIVRAEDAWETRRRPSKRKKGKKHGRRK